MSTVAFLTVALVLASNSQFIFDTIHSHQYQPTEQIASLAADAGMSDKGRFLFYASHPSLEARETFSDRCGHTESTTAILGCYDGRRIYIYNVTDDRLDGIRETTAAHEMLHAAYARLSGKERESINRLLDAEYEKLKTDKNFEARMAFYQRTEPGERHNELHSLVGSEVENISPELANYYSRYFNDREKVVALYQQYNSIFNELSARADDLDAQLSALENRIKVDSTTYNAGVAEIEQVIRDFNARARNGSFSSQAEFSAERQRLLGRLSALEALRSTINSNIDIYDRLAKERQAIATEANELNHSLDSSLAPAPSI